MVKGGSQSQASSSMVAGARSGSGATPRGAAAAGGSGLRRRRIGGSGGSGGGGANNVLRFYTDDAPGLKITPTMVLVMSLCFIGFVTVLHVAGKLYHHKA